MSHIIFEDNYTVVFPSFNEVQPHKHNFYHIFFLTNHDYCDRMYIVGRQVMHTMPPLDQCKLFLLIDPTSNLAETLQRKFPITNTPVMVPCTPTFLDSNCFDSQSLKTWVSKFLLNTGLLPETHKKSTDREKQILHLIEEIKSYHYLEKSISDIAADYHLSESRLSHAFKEYVGISLKGYLNIKQIEYAYKLILSGQSITYAALEAGFSSAAHLASICKKQMGISISAVLK